MKHRPPVPLNDLVKRIKRYPTQRILAAVRDLSVREQDQKEKPWKLERIRQRSGWPTREWIYVTQFDLGFLAKLAILHTSDLRTARLDSNALFELLGLCAGLDDAFLHQEKDKWVLWSFLLRTAWLQFPAQSAIRHVMPRYYTMFRLVNDGIAGRPFDVPSSWKELTGLTIEDTMALGLLLWTRAYTARFFETIELQGPGMGRLRLLAADDNMNRALALGGTDYLGFQRLHEQYTVGDPLYVKTEFNALAKRPLIRIPQQGWIAPIPRLVLERFTGGIFFDLADAFRDEQQHEFLDYFGTLFEHYVGMLLRHGWGAHNVIHEPKYGRQEMRGPDWIVLEGNNALLFECKASRLKMPTKALADQEAVRADMRRMFVEPLKRYPKKVEDLRSGSAGIDLSGVKKFYPCVAVAEKIYWEHIYRDIIDDELRTAGAQPFEYYLVDIELLEIFSGWAGQTSVAAVLEDWSHAKMEGPPIEFEVWVSNRAKELKFGGYIPARRLRQDAQGAVPS
jgi:hypothetical protein